MTADSALNVLAAPRRGGLKTSLLRGAAFQAAEALAAAALPKGAEATVAMVAEVCGMAESLWADIRATPAFALATRRAACAEGCGWCCHQRVEASAVEVLSIAGRLRQRPDAPSLIARIESWPTGRSCAFLRDGACSIYAIRPLKCRGLYQVDPHWCMTTHAKLDPPLSGPKPSHEHLVPPKDVFDGAAFGMALPFHQAGRDCPGVDLMPALQAVIHRPDAVASWWRGETVFPAGTRMHHWFPS